MKFIEPRSGAGAAIVDGAKILLIKRVKDPEASHWGLPGGKIDLFETAEAAIIREVKEEIGIDLKEPFLLCISDLIDEEIGYHWLSPIYLFTEYSGMPMIMEPEKHLGLGWFDIDALPNPVTKAVVDAITALKEK